MGERDDRQARQWEASWGNPPTSDGGGTDGGRGGDPGELPEGPEAPGVAPPMIVAGRAPDGPAYPRPRAMSRSDLGALGIEGFYTVHGDHVATWNPRHRLPVGSALHAGLVGKVGLAVEDVETGHGEAIVILDQTQAVRLAVMVMEGAGMTPDSGVAGLALWWLRRSLGQTPQEAAQDAASDVSETCRHLWPSGPGDDGRRPCPYCAECPDEGF